MSSHREAPEISKDPNADNTDVYAFVSPDAPDTVTLIANFIPFEIPYGGPNFSEFSDDVLYTINIANDGRAQADISYQFRFTTYIRNKNTFLYNTGPIASIDDPHFNRPQYYSVTRVVHEGGYTKSTLLATGLEVPPCNVGERSTPHYQARFGARAVHSLGAKRKVFAGQRSDPFFVDLGSVFDLAGLRPLNQAHLIPLPVMQGMNGLQGMNVHTIALQVPKTDLSDEGHHPTDPLASRSVIGVWASTYRSRARVWDEQEHRSRGHGGWVQVSRLGNPLFNEVINPMSVKDRWNALLPSHDHEFAQYVNKPELAALLPALYPGAFPNLAAFNASGRPRADLHAILLTGIPAAVLKKFTTYTGPVEADLLRLNMAVPPTTDQSTISDLGVLGGDPAGFPNGRRVFDDVTTIELRAVAGLSLPLVYPDYKVDAILVPDPKNPAGLLRDGTKYTNAPLLPSFPYVAPPASGYLTKPPVPAVG